MDLKAARCPSCGGDLDIPEGVDYVECPFCGVDVKVRDIVSHELDTKSLLELAAHELNSGSYKSAIDYYTFILEKEPDNPFALLGVIKSTIKQKWSDGYNIDGVRELIFKDLEKVPEDKKAIYKDNISDFICSLYPEEIKKYKDDKDLAAHAYDFRDNLLALLEISNEINPAHEKTLVTILDFCLKMLKLYNITLINAMKLEKLEAVFGKYSVELGKIDLVKSASYAKNWDELLGTFKTKKRNIRAGCIAFLITAALITLIVWLILKVF